MDPMLLPQANTKSYYLNSLTSSFCPANFVRWCWAAYLQVETYQIEKETAVLDDDFGSDNFLRNNCLLKDNLWFPANGVECRTRLFYPKIELPNDLNVKEAPIIIVKTSTADVLRDDGLDLVEALRGVGANVKHFECVGSHGFSMEVDSKARTQFNKFWYEIIWNK